MLAPLYFVIVNSIKKPIEFYKNPWSIPTTLYLKNYVDAIKIVSGETTLPQMYFNSFKPTFLIYRKTLYIRLSIFR